MAFRYRPVFYSEFWSSLVCFKVDDYLFGILEMDFVSSYSRTRNKCQAQFQYLIADQPLFRKKYPAFRAVAKVTHNK